MSKMADYYGTSGNDILYGGTGNDFLYGYAGNDVLDGGAGADTMDGGDGNDTYYVDNVGDIVKEVFDDSLGGTADTVLASVTYSLAPGTSGNQGFGIENLTLTGSSNINATGNGKNNILKGNSGSNVLDGGAGADNMDGGDGNDTYYVDNVGDIVKEVFDDALGGTADTVFASVTYSLAPGTSGNQGFGIENLTLTGGSNINATGNGKNNILTGNSGSNVLNGGSGADTLIGGNGNDTLIGGAGNDILNGGVGADKFRFNFLSEKVDTIQDFFWTEGDKIEVSASGFGATSLSQITYNAGNGALSFLGNQFATIANIPSGFAVSLDVVLI
jgi:Ca2+-binding RTX toxin-like protein